MADLWTRRAAIKSMAAGAAMLHLNAVSGMAQSAVNKMFDPANGRPAPEDRRFRSEMVEETIKQTRARIGDPALALLFANCFPNTLDTTVEPGRFEGKPDTAVITGDIPAMWLRDSSAQVWPYLPLAKQDPALRDLLEGVIRRQTRCLLIDTYANAFMADLNAPPLDWSAKDLTEMKPGVGERKYELDSLCYPIRLAHGYWKNTGDVKPFDAAWKRAMELVLRTMVEQQRKHGDGPYRFQRTSEVSTETLPGRGYGNPVKPVGLIASGFRPSDDACIFPFLVPSNLFAVTSLRQLAEMAHTVLHDDELANKAQALADEVAGALKRYAVTQTQQGAIWAYEVDGFGGQLLMDDANVPSLLGLPYLDASLDKALYARTRAFVWSERNPWFFKGSAGEGVGGPHEGKNMIWPMSQMVYALTSDDDTEIRRALATLQASAAGTGFMHESYDKDDYAKYTRPWFAWANTLFGELILKVAANRPTLLR
jgi:meiotically up-regulated gene 157 (Mug157) protein